MRLHGQRIVGAVIMRLLHFVCNLRVPAILYTCAIILLLCCLQDVCYNADGSQVISCSSDATVRIWDAKTCEQLHGFRWGM
jgi:WD40 repeat protein